MFGGRPFLGASKPFAAGTKLVDVGCGTAVATIQLANMFPAATVYGIDLSPVPVAVKQVAPKNVHFVQGNILEVNLEKPSRESPAKKYSPHGTYITSLGECCSLESATGNATSTLLPSR
jgi:16S rRNA A1518/A1519 N6-dimethyltransferase RsmA/KsgA/DIM1 with predicted DNA glycosylase/AP lyase activity